MDVLPQPVSAAPAQFERLRGRLFGLAYRMLGSRAEAEDAVQDAYMRYLSDGPGAAMLNLQKEVEASGIDRTLLELIKIRASQSTAARTASTCIRRMLAPRVKRNRASTP